MVIRDGWDARQQPLKASFEALGKLNYNDIYMYFASHNRAPCIRSGLGQRPTRVELDAWLISQNLVANKPAPNQEWWPRDRHRDRIRTYDGGKAFLFIATPDCMLITLEFQSSKVPLDDVKKKYVAFLRELHEQVVPADRVRFFLSDKFMKPLDKKVLNIDKMSRPLLRAMHLEPFQIFVKSLNGRTYTLMVFPCTTILELKQMIQDKMGYYPEHWDHMYLRLHWSHSQWNRPAGYYDDNLSISYFNIQKDSTIRLEGRLRGGAKKGVKKTTKQEKVNITRGMVTPTVFSDVSNAISTLAIIMAVEYL